jgi:hypothetical protein
MPKLISLIALLFLTFSVAFSQKKHTGANKYIKVYPVSFRVPRLNNAVLTRLIQSGYDSVVFQIINYKGGLKDPRHRNEYGLTAYVYEKDRMKEEPDLLDYPNHTTLTMLDEYDKPFDLKTGNYYYKLSKFHQGETIDLVPDSKKIQNYIRFYITPQVRHKSSLKSIKKTYLLAYIDPSPPA